MNILNSFKSAFRALMRNKMRSALTSIGIIIGVSSVIMMIGLGSSAKYEVRNRIQNFGSNGLNIAFINRFLYERDYLNLKKLFTQIRYISPDIHFKNIPLRFEDRTVNSVIYCVNNDYFQMRDWQLTNGRYFLDEEIRSLESVVIIGNTVRTKFFGYYNPIGKMLSISNRPYKIIGVLAESGSSLAGIDFDDIIAIPYTTGMVRYYGERRLDYIQAATYSEEALDDLVPNLKQYLRQTHNLTPNQLDDFRIETSKDKLKMADMISKTLQILLAGVASISLIVGGVGIMNIMLVSVSERTREIGIRMAIGAKRRDILAQFLIESMTLSFVGGTVGIILGLTGYLATVTFLDWYFEFSFLSVIVSFIFSAAVGIFFGYYPARKASSLKPIDALRYE
jgi:putative ABC transport system permease protein